MVHLGPVKTGFGVAFESYACSYDFGGQIRSFFILGQHNAPLTGLTEKPPRLCAGTCAATYNSQGPANTAPGRATKRIVRTFDKDGNLVSEEEYV